MVQCHPGYTFDAVDKACVCQDTEIVDLVRCDQHHRYFYIMVCWRKKKGGEGRGGERMREGVRIWYLSQRRMAKEE